MRTDIAVGGLVAGGCAAAFALFIPNAQYSETLAQPTASQEAIPADQMPQFAADGELVRPQNWERWVMVGSSIGLSYSEQQPTRGPDDAPGMFHNIYMQPGAYDYFMTNAEFAQGTMFAMSMYTASRNADPARGGFYEGDRVSVLEVHVKRAGIDSTGWGFFNFGDDGATAPKVPGQAACYSCHATNAAFDHVFTQFYPPLRTRLGQIDAAARTGGH